MNRKNQGLAGGAEPHPVQESWLEQDVAPCGYCRPGQIMAAVALPKRTKNSADADADADADEIANVCRCGRYYRVRGAIRSAAVRTG